MYYRWTPNSLLYSTQFLNKNADLYRAAHRIIHAVTLPPAALHINYMRLVASNRTWTSSSISTSSCCQPFCCGLQVIHNKTAVHNYMIHLDYFFPVFAVTVVILLDNQVKLKTANFHCFKHRSY